MAPREPNLPDRVEQAIVELFAADFARPLLARVGEAQGRSGFHLRGSEAPPIRPVVTFLPPVEWLACYHIHVSHHYRRPLGSASAGTSSVQH
jgi:hypothetical protein